MTAVFWFSSTRVFPLAVPTGALRRRTRTHYCPNFLGPVGEGVGRAGQVRPPAARDSTGRGPGYRVHMSPPPPRVGKGPNESAKFVEVAKNRKCGCSTD